MWRKREWLARREADGAPVVAAEEHLDIVTLSDEDIEREEVGLRDLLGAIEAVEDGIVDGEPPACR